MSESDEAVGLGELVQGHLASEWLYVTEGHGTASNIDPAIGDAIRRSINSKTKTYRYVLPTQLLSKLARPDLDCRSIQAGSGLAGSFDARSICHGVIVPFDRENNDVLGGSSEPYLNNPLRIPAIRPPARQAQKDKDGFDDLMKVLDYAQENPQQLVELVREVLSAIKDRLAGVSVTYPVPNRASLQQADATLRHFLGDHTGGLRLQAVAVALFRVIGTRFKLFTDVRSRNINAADASTGNAADLECIDDAGDIVMAVEVKDRQLELRQVQDKLPAAREKGIRELLFLVQGGTADGDEQSVTDTITREFVTGQNLYVLEWDEFIGSCLVLFGEAALKVIVFESLGQFARNEALSGWVRGTELPDAKSALDELVRLQKENTDLQRALADAREYARQVDHADDGISGDATELLLAAVQADGYIMFLHAYGGAHLQVGNRNFIPSESSPREEARWTAVLEELLAKGLIQRAGTSGETFSVTHAGYQLADKLAKK